MGNPNQLSFRSWSLRSLAAAGVAAVIVITALLIVSPGIEQAPPKVAHDIPDEVLCKVPHARGDDFPAAIESDTPIIRLLELSPGHYQLLYWGNPIRKSYFYTIKRLSNGESVLRKRTGETIEKAHLPVMLPAREDKKLPRQPLVEIGRVSGEPGVSYAVKITVHDGTTGTPLYAEYYVIEGEPPQNPL